MNDLAPILAASPVIPVMTVTSLQQAEPMAEALLEGGLTVLEVTLRTEAALPAIERIAARFPDAWVGAGTVTAPTQARRAGDAGARFLVSPGCSRSLLEAFDASGLPALPGVATVSEAMGLRELGYRHLKLFPAEAVGGVGWLRSVAGPLPELRFCPTGGIGPAQAPAYLALANVACVGGSWMLPRGAVAAGRWAEITRLAAAAAALRGGGHAQESGQ